jgi:hypothetical protein
LPGYADTRWEWSKAKVYEPINHFKIPLDPPLKRGDMVFLFKKVYWFSPLIKGSQRGFKKTTS